MDSTSNIHEYVLWLTWSVFTLTAAHLKNPAIDLVLTSQDVVESMLAIFTFAPGLMNAVHESTYPTLAFLKSLPTDGTRKWGIYLLVLEKLGQRPRVYVGSATNKVDGVVKRWKNYDAHSALPSRVSLALDDGFIITHKGLLCWCDVPAAADRYKLRGLILVLETALSVLFWAMEFKTKDYGLPKHLSPWNIDTADYYGLCSHAAFAEGMRGEHEDLTTLEIEEREAAMLQRQSDQKKARYHGAKERDWDSWKATRRRYEAKRDVVEKRASTKKTAAKAKAEGRFKCPTCEIPFESQNNLNEHYKTQGHNDKVKGIAKKPPKNPDYAVWAAHNLAMKKYYCRFCDRNHSTQQKLDSHYKAAYHAKNKARVLAEEKAKSAELAAAATEQKGEKSSSA